MQGSGVFVDSVCKYSGDKIGLPPTCLPTFTALPTQYYILMIVCYGMVWFILIESPVEKKFWICLVHVLFALTLLIYFQGQLFCKGLLPKGQPGVAFF